MGEIATTRILAIGEVGDKTGGDRPREHCICVCLHILVSNTHCVVFLFCFSSSCVSYVASFSGLSIFDLPFGIL